MGGNACFRLLYIPREAVIVKGLVGGGADNKTGGSRLDVRLFLEGCTLLFSFFDASDRVYVH
jgi:hypothetical protein